MVNTHIHSNPFRCNDCTYDGCEQSHNSMTYHKYYNKHEVHQAQTYLHSHVVFALPYHNKHTSCELSFSAY